MFFAKIQRHTSQNAITEGDLREQRVKVVLARNLEECRDNDKNKPE